MERVVGQHIGLPSKERRCPRSRQNWQFSLRKRFLRCVHPLGLRHEPVEAKPPPVPRNLLSLISVGTTSFIHVVGNKFFFVFQICGFFQRNVISIDHGSFWRPAFFFVRDIEFGRVFDTTAVREQEASRVATWPRFLEEACGGDTTLPR